MRRAQTASFCLLLAVSALAAVLFVFPGLAAAVGLDFWNVPNVVDALGQEAQLDDRLDGEVQAALRRTTAKWELAGEAVEGRLTLFEAAARFRDLDADTSEDYRRGWRCLAGGASDEERYCRQVLAYARLVLGDRSDDPAALERLEAQLDQALARGDLRLPE